LAPSVSLGSSGRGGIDRSEYLLVLGHAVALPPRPDEPNDTDGAKKTGKARRRGG
jgi:hypothetical protein